MGIIYSILAGVAMSIQGVFNTRLSEKIGLWQTNLIVQGTALVLSLIIMFFNRNLDLRAIKDSNKLYLLGGIIGVAIVYTVMKGIKLSGPTCAISVILISQLTSAAAIEYFGVFHTDTVKFNIFQISGLILILLGILVFKCKICLK